MRIRSKLALGLASLLLAAAVPAHHAEPVYDLKNPIAIRGQVTRVEWSNPHVYLHVRVATGRGVEEEWLVELASPNTLKRRGWRKDTAGAGAMITCTGGRSRSGARTMRAITVELSDGKRLKG